MCQPVKVGIVSMDIPAQYGDANIEVESI